MVAAVDCGLHYQKLCYRGAGVRLSAVSPKSPGDISIPGGFGLGVLVVSAEITVNAVKIGH